MGQSIKSNEITNQILIQQQKSQLKQSMTLRQSKAGVSLQAEYIASIRKLIETLLSGAQKMTISNNNQRNKEGEPIVVLNINLNGFRLIIKKPAIRMDYILNLERNVLLLNDNPATQMDANQFKHLFNKVLNRMVTENYEVIKNS